MKLYRPVGIRELELIKQSGMTEVSQGFGSADILSVLNRKYACQIAGSGIQKVHLAMLVLSQSLMWRMNMFRSLR